MVLPQDLRGSTNLGNVGSLQTTRPVAKLLARNWIRGWPFQGSLSSLKKFVSPISVSPNSGEVETNHLQMKYKTCIVPKKTHTKSIHET